jgi:heme-degrading monooxygenase HmoA
MKQFNVFNQISMVLGALVVGSFFLASTTSAQQVVVFNHYQEIPDKKAQLSQVIDKEVSKRLVGVKGLEWTKFLYNPLTGERGSIFIWTSQKDWQAYQQSDLRKELVSKVKPFIQGEVSSKSYSVYEPKK